MTEGVITQQEAQEHIMHIPIERMSWGILVASFLLFCLTCVASSIGLYYFLFVSTMPLNVNLQVGRGTTVISNEDVSRMGVREPLALTTRPVEVDNDGQEQTILIISDEASDTPAMTITLQSNSKIRLASANGPRFRWSNTDYTVILDSFRGEADIYVFDAQRASLLRIFDQANNQIDIISPGRYLLKSINGRLYVDNRYGQALFRVPDVPNANKIVPAGDEWIDTTTTLPARLLVRRENLLENGLFAFVDPSVSYNGATHIPSPWACGSLAEGPPSSTFSIEQWEGRQAIRFVRAGGAQDHGETFCQQSMGDVGVSLEDYSYLELETTFYINFQSLSKCGRDGSECPLMLRLRFETDTLNEDGEVETTEWEWIQGLYYLNDPQRDYPSQCISCINAHQQINQKVWYTYRSTNLISAMDAAGLPRPSRIKDIQFYASGHDYDVFVSEIGLYRGLVDITALDVLPESSISPSS